MYSDGNMGNLHWMNNHGGTLSMVNAPEDATTWNLVVPEDDSEGYYIQCEQGNQVYLSADGDGTVLTTSEESNATTWKAVENEDGTYSFKIVEQPGAKELYLRGGTKSGKVLTDDSSANGTNWFVFAAQAV